MEHIKKMKMLRQKFLAVSIGTGISSQFMEKQHSRSLIPVFLTYFLDNFGLAIIYPIFTPLLLKSNISFLSTATAFFERTLTLGLLIASFPLAQFFGAPLIGQFSDRYGRKRSFYITILGTAIGYVLTALSISSPSLALLFMSRFITGLFAGNLTICLAAVADLSPDEHSRARNFGHISAIGGLSFILAILLGGLLSDPSLSHHFSPSFPFWMTAGLSFLNFGVMVLLFRETHPTQSRLTIHPFKGVKYIKLGLESLSLRYLFVVNFFFKFGWVALMQFYPSFLISRYHYHIDQITFSLVLVGVIWSLANLFINKPLAERVYPPKTFFYCLLLLGLLSLIEMIHWSQVPFFLFFYPAVACASLSWTNGLTSISLKASHEMQGSILGINQSVTSAASVFGSALGGVLIGFSHYFTFLLSGVCCLFAFGMLYWTRVFLPESKPS
jgi:DHA1 family tetracycline resistance protein-like MFS transporter